MLHENKVIKYAETHAFFHSFKVNYFDFVLSGPGPC